MLNIIYIVLLFRYSISISLLLPVCLVLFAKFHFSVNGSMEDVSSELSCTVVIQGVDPVKHSEHQLRIVHNIFKISFTNFSDMSKFLTHSFLCLLELSMCPTKHDSSKTT